jgi:hypothetical protein
MAQSLTLTEMARLADQVREVNATLAASDAAQTEAEARVARLEQFADRVLALGARYDTVRQAQAQIETLVRETARLERLITSLHQDVQTLEQRRDAAIAARDAAVGQRDQAERERDTVRDALATMKREWRRIEQTLDARN